MIQNFQVLDFPISNMKTDELVSFIHERAKTRQNGEKVDSRTIHFLNAFCITEANRMPKLKKIYCSELSMNFIDGKSLWLLKRIMERTSLRQMRGADFTRQLLSEKEPRSIRVGLIGGTESTISSIHQNLISKFGILKFEYISSLPMSEVSAFPLETLIAALVQNRIDLCFIAIGTPKQDELADYLARNVDVDFACVGAAMEFVSGLKRECPTWLAKIGFEWLFRLLSEPSRLWKRYLIGLPMFLKIALKFYSSKYEKNSRYN